MATFETEPRTAEQVAAWIGESHPVVVVAESPSGKPVGFAAGFPYRARACYAGIAEFSVYVARTRRGSDGSRWRRSSRRRPSTASGSW